MLLFIEWKYSFLNISFLLLSLGFRLETFSAFCGIFNLLAKVSAFFGLIRIIAASFILLSHFVLSLLVVFGQVAILAHSVRVMRLVRMATGISHLSLTLSMVAVVAHVFGVMLSPGMRALIDFSSLPLSLIVIRISFMNFRFFLRLRWSDFFTIKWSQLIYRFLNIKLNSLCLFLFLIVHGTKLVDDIVHKCVVQVLGGNSGLRVLILKGLL